VEGGTADRGAAPAARGDARRRRVRGVDPGRAYRCPPGPYERACQVAWYFKRAKPKSKVLILDGNGDVTSKGALFKKAWAEEYKGIVEYRGNHVLADVDVAASTAKFDVHDAVKADVLNVLPPQRAGAIARAAGVVTANDRWCDVDFLTFESVKVKNVHVLGDAIQFAPACPSRATWRISTRRSARRPWSRCSRGRRRTRRRC